MQVYAPRKLDKKENLITGHISQICILMILEKYATMLTWFVCNNLVNVSVSSLQFSYLVATDLRTIW